jgi:hypothetical protein
MVLLEFEESRVVSLDMKDVPLPKLSATERLVLSVKGAKPAQPFGIPARRG